MINSNWLFRILSILVIISINLPIVFKNLPYPIGSFIFYYLLWGISLIIFKIDILISYKLKYIYLYVIISIFMVFSFWNSIGERNIGRIQSEIYELLIAITMMKYFIKSNDLRGLKIVLIVTFISIGITCITSLVGLSAFPMAARDLAGMLAEAGRTDLIDFYSLIGIAHYTFYTTLIFFIPVFIGLIKYSIFKRSTNILIGILVILIFITIVESQYFSNILNSVFIAIIALNGRKNIKSSIVFGGIYLFAFLFIPTDYYITILRGIQPIFNGSFTETKIDDLIITISGPDGKNTGIEERASAVPVLWESFLSNPFWGGGFDNAHLHWLNKLSVYGLIGVIPFFLILFHEVKSNLKIIKPNYHFFYLIGIASFLFQGYMKSLLGNGVMLTIYFIIPALLFFNTNKISKAINK